MMFLVCPICDEVSNAAHNEADSGLRFQCRTCGDYSISDMSSLALPRFKPAMRQNFLRIAASRAGPNNVPHISHID